MRFLERGFRTMTLAAGMMLASTISPGADDLPRAPQAQVFSLTPTPGFFTEPGVAVDPSNPKQVVVVFQDNAHAAYSRDAGKSWQVAEGVAPENYRISGDVSVVFDNQGHAFICYIAFDKLGTFNYWAHGATRNGIFVRRSLDGGKTWDADHVPVTEQMSNPGIPFEDKPYIVADNSHSKYSGNLYVGWTRWRLTDSQMLISRSSDGGKTWSQPIEINAHPGLPRDDNGAAEGFDGTVAPDGTLYATWSQDNDVMFTSSRDGGKTFSRARAVIHTAPVMFAVETLDRANGFPQIAIDPKSAQLYVSWSDYRNGDLDVFVSRSDDRGKHWSAPIRVNNDPVHNGAEQFFQWLAVDPVDGSVSLLFYDRRRDPKNLQQIVVLARSTDGGRTFNNYAWTEQPFEAGGVFFGDYSGIAAYGGRVYGAWTEKLVAEPEEETKPNADKKPRPRGTVVKVGTADFTGHVQ
jgi:BNR repeat-like domain